MIYTTIDTFCLSAEQLQNTPSRKDGIDEATEMTLRLYGCDLIQESGILLKLPQQAMATGQVLFHRFYCKKSFVRFNVKRVAASCIWLASKLEENPRRSRHILNVFYRMECRRENLPIEHLDTFSKLYMELKIDLFRCERHLLKELGFICHVEHPHKFISNYLATLETPQELRQEAWNLANDSLRTTLCVRFKSEVVACGVVYAAARRFHVPLPESPPWWEAFDADKTGIDEVCRVLAHLYTLPKAQYIPEILDDPNSTKLSPPAVIPDSKDALIKAAAIGMLKDSSNESMLVPVSKSKADHRRDTSREQSREKDRRRKRGRDSEREKAKDRRSHRSKDSGHAEKPKHHASRDRDYHGSSYS